MSQATQATVSRRKFNTACVVAAVSLLALLISVFWPSGKNGEFADLGELGRVLANDDLSAVLAVDRKGRFKLFFQDGSPIESCGRRGSDTTEVPAACGIKGTAVTSTTFTFGQSRGSDCDYGNDGPGHYYSWHTESPYKNKGPCHSSAHPGH